MKGIRLARSSGLNVGCIATFTPWSAHRWRDVFDFFLEQRLGMSIHASVPWVGRTFAINGQESPLDARRVRRHCIRTVDSFLARDRSVN